MNVIYGLHIGDRRWRYVGQTTVGVVRRLRSHYTSARSGFRLPVYNWMRKHDGCVVIEVLEVVTDNAFLDAREGYWIGHLRDQGFPLLNVAEAGTGAGLALGRGWNKGKSHPATSIANKGKPKSDLHRSRISESLKGQIRSASHRSNLSKALKGRSFSEETKRRISKGQRGRRPTIGPHTRWHTNKSVSKPDTCKFCKEEVDALHGR